MTSLFKKLTVDLQNAKYRYKRQVSRFFKICIPHSSCSLIIMKDLLRKDMRAIKAIKKNAGIKIKIFKREIHRNILYFFYYLYNYYV